MYWTEEHDKLMCREILAVEPFEVAVAVMLNMLRRVERDAGLASGFTRMCRRRRHLPSWCLRSLLTASSSSCDIAGFTVSVMPTDSSSRNSLIIAVTSLFSTIVSMGDVCFE